MRCLIVDELHPSIKQGLTNLDIDFSYRPKITRDEIKKILGEFDGLIIRSKTKVDSDLISRAALLKFVARAGAGVDHIDTDLLHKKGIEIINAPEGNMDSVAEHSVGLILNLLNNITSASREVEHLTWKREANRGEELTGMTVGIIGYGNMGSALAQRLSTFGCRTIAYDKYKKGFGNHLCGEVSMNEIFIESDILSLHIPLTDETDGMCDNHFFESFKKNIILINTSRGEIVPLTTLDHALSSGKIRKAGLDVLEFEKFKNCSPKQIELIKKIVSRLNVIVTPHIAGWTYNSYRKINETLIKKIKQFVEKD